MIKKRYKELYKKLATSFLRYDHVTVEVYEKELKELVEKAFTKL